MQIKRTLSNSFIASIRKVLRQGAPDTKFKTIHHVFTEHVNFSDKEFPLLDGVNLRKGESWTFVATDQKDSKNNGVYVVTTTRHNDVYTVRTVRQGENYK